MINLRQYQVEATDAVFNYWLKGGGNPLIELATGTGKSLVIAEIVRRILADYPSMNILMLVHTRELVRQNYDELLALMPGTPVGINSAGLGRRDLHTKILFASIQSVARYHKGALGKRDLVLVDEAHLIPHKESGQYRSLLEKLREEEPDLRVCGLTATPYRLDSGRLDEGEDRLFHKIVYTYDIGKGVDDGYLAPLVARGSKNTIDVSNVGRRGGEFVANDLQTAAERVTEAACDEIAAKGVDRNKWLAFCAGVDHAYSVRDALRERGITCETITGKTPKADRDRFIEQFKNGAIRCLTNANVLTTGFNIKQVDLLAMLRPTLSTSLYIQMMGRGTRMAPGKDDCLVLDFSGNVIRHGPVDAPQGCSKGKKKGRADISTVAAKECPECGTLVGLRTLVCEACDYEWPVNDEPKHNSRSDQNVVLLTRELKDKWIKINGVRAYNHVSQAGKTSMRVEYDCGLQIYKEYIPIGHPGYPGEKARRWMSLFIGTSDSNINEAITLFNQRASRLLIQEIQVRKDGEYWRIYAWRNTHAWIDEKLNIYERKDLKHAG